MTIGIIGGSSFLSGALAERLSERVVSTARGDVTLLAGDGWVLLPRHGAGAGDYRPAHRVDHHAHALAFRELSVSRVVGFCSVGALDPELAPGTVVVVDDYYSVFPPPTTVGDESLHIVPELNAALRVLLAEAAGRTAGPVAPGGVYLETRGPRFETKAEVRAYRRWGDVVGMTGASEATILQECGIEYAILAMVDNLANGLDTAPLTYEDFQAQVAANEARVRAVLLEFLALCREGEAS